jgi:hypothetical protein
VKSGQLVAPGIPQAAEHELMEKIISTYGKTWHTWPMREDARLPLGAPQLMMGFTAEGQINPALLTARDQRFDLSAEAKKQNRADIPAPQIQPGADAWQQGQAVQVQLAPVAGASNKAASARR